MKKVLVLEDEANIRSFIVINLRRYGYEPVEAETGEEALDRLRENPDIGVALLDVMLPGIGGGDPAECVACVVGVWSVGQRGELRGLYAEGPREPEGVQ